MARYRAIADALRARIGPEFGLGQQLPTIAALQVEYGVRSLNTVRDALRILADEGWVSVEHGRGSFVAAIPSPRTPLDVTPSDALDLLGITAAERRVLETRASAAGVPVGEYVRNVLGGHAGAGTNAEVLARAARRSDRATASSLSAIHRERESR